ncbi:MAG: hypothetical protein A2402_03745 [Candidatus Staskawiczbacteria bacterium RIFOXYC1_FULL_37_43]|nr:MAG: hypothetical protein A2813_01525 [Candidatus Staskawiczbacteria bacterium RIFCSPHIGHO2_01_FULL_37_17]OGZ72078.1 MAG: hypothetical protein A2891_01550 [Candidatus Staskawiczbacteria bacterium RIFCSPLOWO2_01_FULL_37_19]OGZ75756.1 MAG: hypothetical protein A2205_02665 [Candidatus Staskawiczbacteria bacterium RIFOXYA1_FULL_37_15]OGZ77193.1 MAG: hypothetical protein A2280_02140 [Candidatus Staskawiczbacteria bacterium RIFOXYA12_FULL_37_10]OGZ80646.1 MAG: hypothetical protein A2353_00345 [Can
MNLDREAFIDKTKKDYKRFISKENKEGLEEWWRETFNQAAKTGKKEHEVLLLSESGPKNHQRYFSEYLRKINFSESAKGLDAGCGIGSFAFLLEQKGIEVFGVDFSEEMIALVKKNPKSKNIDFRIANVCNLPFKDSFFDIVICMSTFQSILYSEKALKELKRVLKKKGLIIITTLNKSAINFWFKRNDPFLRNPYRFKSLMEQQGFSDFKLRGIYSFPSRFDFLTDLILKHKIFNFLNLFFPFFRIFSSSFYIEAIKK